MSESTANTTPRLSLLDSAAFAARKYPRHWLIDDVLVARQPCVIGGPMKSLKTSVAVDLAVSLGTGTPFLGRFRVAKRRRVAVFSGESGAASLKETAQRVCQSRVRDLDGETGVFWGFRLPRLCSGSDRRELQGLLREHKIEVIVIDPLYLCLIAGSTKAVSPSNLYEVGAVLLQVAELCAGASATLVLVHHTTKGGGKSSRGETTLNDLAFAGIGEFARQWLLLSRLGEYAPWSGKHDLSLSVGGSAGHSSRWHIQVDEGGREGVRRWQVKVKPDDGAAPAAGPKSARRQSPFGTEF